MFDYAAVATEYYDPVAHPTCHNFSRLSRRYIAEELTDCTSGARILELGAGDSSAAAALCAQGFRLNRLEITDVSEAMLGHSTRWAALGATLQVADATELPHPSGSFDYVVAGLADPYNVPGLWSSIARVLGRHGRALVTLPSYEWAKRFRGNQKAADFHSAEFTLRDGSVVSVPSFVHPLAHQIRLIEEAGLSLSCFRSLGVDILRDDLLSPKVNVFGESTSSLVWGFTARKISREKAPLA
ncbi:MAG: class I SAM-dependent methyltransferase [Burkholderiales bacterium]|nr:class I SAM-dependent methyltransferase [Burkholderiales bacterium]